MVVTDYIAEISAIAIMIIAAGTELLHMLRTRALAPLVFGPTARAAIWTLLAPPARMLAMGMICWGLVTLIFATPRTHNSEQIDVAKQKHVVLLLDVSPSMRLVDAGPEKDQSRSKRASAVLASLFDRVPIRQYRLSLLAFYNETKPVVVETNDLEVIMNALNDLPMHYAFNRGETDLFKGLEATAELAKPWQPDSTIVIVISDGDTVPATGMPKMPPSISNVLLVGVGDPVTGKFIGGRNSRQDVSTLRQVATRLNGDFQNGNTKHISSSIVNKITQNVRGGGLAELSRREYALLAIGLGAVVLSILPVLLHYFGTFWQPGIRYTSVTQHPG